MKVETFNDEKTKEFKVIITTNIERMLSDTLPTVIKEGVVEKTINEIFKYYEEDFRKYFRENMEQLVKEVKQEIIVQGVKRLSEIETK